LFDHRSHRRVISVQLHCLGDHFDRCGYLADFHSKIDARQLLHLQFERLRHGLEPGDFCSDGIRSR
jgi:hypothetical protein